MFYFVSLTLKIKNLSTQKNIPAPIKLLTTAAIIAFPGKK